MKIVVCIKQVPDSTAKVVVEQGRVSWGDAPLIMNPWDEYAVEAALQQKEALGGTITAVTIGDESSKEALKRALAMGADDAILICDPALVQYGYPGYRPGPGGCHPENRRSGHGLLWSPGH